MVAPSNQGVYCKTAAVQQQHLDNLQNLDALSINVCNAPHESHARECRSNTCSNTTTPNVNAMNKPHLPLTPLDQGYSTSSSNPEITYITHNTAATITPHSVLINNRAYHTATSASVHSSASNNTLATTIIESASDDTNSSPPNRSPSNSSDDQSVNAHNNAVHAAVHDQSVNAMNVGNAVNAALKSMTSPPGIPAPKLANPLPSSVHNVPDGVVVPMDNQQYDALLKQMYGDRASNAVNNANAVTAPPPGYGPIPLSTRSKQIQGMCFETVVCILSSEFDIFIILLFFYIVWWCFTVFQLCLGSVSYLSVYR